MNWKKTYNLNRKDKEISSTMMKAFVNRNIYMVTLALALGALVCIGVILFVGLFIANEYFKTKDFMRSNLCRIDNITLMGMCIR